MGTDAAGIIPDGTSIEFVSTDAAKGSANGIYETMARYCDEQISKAVLGQTLTSDSGGGSFAQSKTHNDVRHDLTVADCKALAATLRDDLIRPLVLFNFGADAAERLPQLVFDCAESEDLTALAGILNTLSGMGVPLPLSHIYKKFSIPEPEPGEAVTRPVGFPQAAFKQIVNKAPAAPNSQARTDAIADEALRLGIPLFEKMAKPLAELTAQAESPAQLLEQLERDGGFDELLAACESDELTDLLARAMLAADLEGRVREHGG